MPVPIPGPEVGSDSLKVKLLTFFRRPKICFFGRFPGPRGTFPQFPLATNHADLSPPPPPRSPPPPFPFHAGEAALQPLPLVVCVVCAWASGAPLPDPLQDPYPNDTSPYQSLSPYETPGGSGCPQGDPPEDPLGDPPGATPWGAPSG